MFVNILTPDDKCFLLNRDNLRQRIQMQLSQKQKTFSEFVSAIWRTRLIFEPFQRKMTIIADAFTKLQTPKNMVK